MELIILEMYNLYGAARYIGSVVQLLEAVRSEKFEWTLARLFFERTSFQNYRDVVNFN